MVVIIHKYFIAHFAVFSQLGLNLQKYNNVKDITDEVHKFLSRL